jgi:hypothetical protein
MKTMGNGETGSFARPPKPVILAIMGPELEAWDIAERRGGPIRAQYIGHTSVLMMRTAAGGQAPDFDAARAAIDTLNRRDYDERATSLRQLKNDWLQRRENIGTAIELRPGQRLDEARLKLHEMVDRLEQAWNGADPEAYWIHPPGGEMLVGGVYTYGEGMFMQPLAADMYAFREFGLDQAAGVEVVG